MINFVRMFPYLFVKIVEHIVIILHVCLIVPNLEKIIPCL